MILLYDKTTDAKLACLDDIIIDDSISITRKINGEFTLRFEALETNLKSEYFQGDTYVMADGQLFDIAYVEQLHSDILTYRIEGEHVTYRLISDKVPYYTFDGTPAQILSDILIGTGFSAGTVDDTRTITFAVYEETNRLGLVQLLANYINAEIGYDGFNIDLKNTVGMNRGFEARFGKNITGVKKVIDKRNGLTYYSVDIVELKSHPDFRDFASLEVIEEGDTIRIVDDVMGLDVVNRVIKRTYNPIKSINTSLEIANSIELLSDTVTRLQRETVAKNKLYHGIRISPDNGFESIRSDNMARGVFNSDTFALQTGDGSGENWQDAIYFDAAQKKYIFNGELIIGAGGGGGDVDLGAGYEIYDDKADPSIRITKDLIDIKDGKIRIYNYSGQSVILNAYGIDTNMIKYFKNLVWNSQFEIFRGDDKKPDYWSGGTADSNASFFNSVSLKLIPGQSSQTTGYTINPQWYATEGFTKTRVSFYRKGGQVKIEVLDEMGSCYTISDNFGNSDESITTPETTGWLNSRYTISFEHGEHTGAKIKFTNVGNTDAYIDAVQLEPDFTGMWPSFYTDGPASMGDGNGNYLGEGSNLDDIYLYSDGMYTYYSDGSMHSWGFTKDTEGRIVLIENLTLSKSTNVNWSQENKPATPPK